MKTEILRRLAGIPVGKTSIKEGERAHEVVPTANILFPTGVSVEHQADGTVVRGTSYKPSLLPYQVAIEADAPVVLKDGDQTNIRRVLGLVSLTINRTY